MLFVSSMIWKSTASVLFGFFMSSRAMGLGGCDSFFFRFRKGLVDLPSGEGGGKSWNWFMTDAFGRGM